MTVAVSLPLASAPALRAYDIPDADRTEFLRCVSIEERSRVRELLLVFGEMEKARTLKEGAARAAGERRHLGRGWEAKTLLDLYRVYINGGYKPGDWRKQGARFARHDWRALVRDYRRSDEAGLPEEFATFWKGVFAEFRGRDDCVRAAWRHLIHNIWLAGKPVDGFGTVDQWCARHGRARPNPVLIRLADLPHGWGERNLRRLLPLRRATRKRLAHGYLEAHAHQPDMVLGDRSHLLPFGRVLLDDVRPDMRSLWFGTGGRGEIVYPLMVLGLDISSGVDLANVTKPRALKDPENPKGGRHGVTRDMSRLVVCNILRQWGLPPHPITFVHENAAACLDTETKALLSDAFGDRIRFESTAIFRERMLAHGFTESGGCPWDKAQIEVFFRLLATQTANLPGATGPRFDKQHGELREAEKYALACLDRANGAADIIAALRSPILRFEHLDEHLQAALRLLRFRTQHALQGFDQLVEWRLDGGPWRPEAELATLSPEQMDRAEIVRRLESPAERFVRKMHGLQFTPVDPDLLDYISGERRKVRVRSGKITWGDVNRGSAPLVFREAGHTLLEDDYEGEEFEAALAPDASRVVLARDGRLVGSVAQQGRVNLADREAVLREAGRVRAARVADRDTMRGYLADADQRMESLIAHNERVLGAVEAPRIAAPAETRRQTKATADRQRARAAQMAAAARERLADA